MNGKDLVRWAMLAALTSAGCTYILGVEGEHKAGGTSGPGADAGSGGDGAGAGSSGGGNAGGGNAGGAGGSSGVGGGGSGPVTLADSGAEVDSVAVDGMYAYWIVHPGSSPAEVQRTLKAGNGAPSTQVLEAAGLKDIAVAAGVLVAASNTEVYREPLDGSSAGAGSWTATANVGGVVVDASYLYFTDGQRIRAVATDSASLELLEYEDETLGDIAKNANNVFWTEGAAIQWQAAMIDPDLPNTTFTATALPDRIAADDEHVCWTAPSSSMVYCIAASGSLAGSLEVSGTPSAIAVRGGQVYWTERAEGRVMRAPVALDSSEPLVEGEDDPSSIAVDDQFVYWTNYTSGTVRRLARPL